VPRCYYTSDELGERPEDNPPGELILFDAAILRPLGLAATVIGMVSSILVTPWAITSHSECRVGRELVEKPFNYTFERPLGTVDYCDH